LGLDTCSVITENYKTGLTKTVHHKSETCAALRGRNRWSTVLIANQRHFWGGLIFDADTENNSGEGFRTLPLSVGAFFITPESGEKLKRSLIQLIFLQWSLKPLPTQLEDDYSAEVD
jgi:hypothetical protein